MHVEKQHKFRSFNFVTLLLAVFFGSLIADWFIQLITSGFALKPFLNILIVCVFYLLSYLIEEKMNFKTRTKIISYTSYFFSVGTAMSGLVYENPLNFQIFFIYLFLSLIGAIVWLALVYYMQGKSLFTNEGHENHE